MLVIKTKLKEVKGKGIGLIADQEIKKGQSTWVYNPIVDIKVKKKSIPSAAKGFFNVYSVDIGKDFIILNTDNARFTNHSDDPNTKSLGLYKDNIAIKNIHKGEEITINYNEIDVNGVDF